MSPEKRSFVAEQPPVTVQVEVKTRTQIVHILEKGGIALVGHGIVSLYSNCPGNAAPSPEASRNRDVARVADKAMKFPLSAPPRTRSPDTHRRWNRDALLHC